LPLQVRTSTLWTRNSTLETCKKTGRGYTQNNTEKKGGAMGGRKEKEVVWEVEESPVGLEGGGRGETVPWKELLVLRSSRSQPPRNGRGVPEKRGKRLRTENFIWESFG